MAQFFSYIGNNLQSAEIAELYEIIRDSCILSAEQHQRINGKIKAIQDEKKTWRDKVIEGYEVHSGWYQQMNQEWTTQIEKTNKTRTKKLEKWKEVARYAQQRIDSLAQLSLKDS